MIQKTLCWALGPSSLAGGCGPPSETTSPGGQAHRKSSEKAGLEAPTTWKVKVNCSVMSGSLPPQGLYSPWNSPGQNTGVGSLSLLQGNLPNPGIEPRSPALQEDSLPAEPQGKPKNTGAGSLSLLQGIFPIQESNQGLLHSRQILYQLSYQGSPGLRAMTLRRREHGKTCDLTP